MLLAARIGVLVGWVMRRILDRFHLLQVPRVAFLLSLVMALLIMALVPVHAQDKVTFKIWHYEAADSAMGQSWADAQADFEAAHPDVEVVLLSE